MFRCFILLLLLVATSPVTAEERVDAEAICADGQPVPCRRLPNDIPEFSSSFEYRFLGVSAQLPFDRFAWQSFSALVADRSLWGTESIDEHAASPCVDKTEGARMVLTRWRQTDGFPLIDRDGNFVLYHVHANRAVKDVIASHRTGQAVIFPSGYDTDDQTGEVGAMILKSAWKIMLPGDVNQHRYLISQGYVALSSEETRDGTAKCLPLTLGLIGLHIARKTTSGNGDAWIWATFEHENTAPDAANARSPNAILSNDLFPDGCRSQHRPGQWDLFTPSSALPANQPAAPHAVWQNTPPFAGDLPRSKIVRCWQIWRGTEELNQVWRHALTGTAASHYRLVGTQWKGNPGGDVFGAGELPRYLTNTTMESFGQQTGSCLSCHATAQTAEGAPADFTFLLNTSP